MASVRLINLSKYFGKQLIVDNLSLEIHDGEFVVLLGPSGCGKTTTMRMIAGLEECSAGEIWLGERRVNSLAPKDRDVSMVFQNYGLYPHLSVYENIRFPLKVRGVPSSEHSSRVQTAAEMVEMVPYLDRRPAELSGGQRQRVAVARAIVREPSVFLMDEPLSNLDAKLRLSTRAQIKHLHHRLKVTTIYVTHDQVEAMTLADRVVVMSDGVVQQFASPQEIYDRPGNIFVAGFVGSPAMNLIEGTLSEGVFTAEGVRVEGLPNGGASRSVIAGFRAEDASLVESGGQLEATLYSRELLGDASMASFRIGGALVSIRAPKDFSAPIGASLHAAIPARSCHLFDVRNGRRLER